MKPNHSREDGGGGVRQRLQPLRPPQREGAPRIHGGPQRGRHSHGHTGSLATITEGAMEPPQVQHRVTAGPPD